MAPTYEPRVYLSYRLEPKGKEPYEGIMIPTVMQRLRSKNTHIFYGPHSPSLDWVHVAVVFISKDFVTTSSHELERLLEHKKLKGLRIVAVLYEPNPDSRLVTDIISSDNPDLGAQDHQENTRLGNLVSEFLDAASPKIIFHPSTTTKTSVIHDLVTLADAIVEDINPFEIDYTLYDTDEVDDDLWDHNAFYYPVQYPSTALNRKLFYDVINNMSNTFYNDIICKPGRLSGPSLISIFEACGLTNCCCEINTISKIVYTHIYNWSRGLTFDYYLYLSSSSSPRSSTCSSSSSSSSSSLSSSLFDVFQYEMHKKYHFSYSSGDDTSLFFVVIDDLQSFVTETEDATQVLATFVNFLGSGSLVVATSSTPMSTRMPMQPLGCIRGSKCVLSHKKKTKRLSSSNSTGHSDSDSDSLVLDLFGSDSDSELEDPDKGESQQWPACFTIWNSQLNVLTKKLQQKEIVACLEMDTDDDQKQKSHHAMDFEPSGNVRKKLKETVT